MICKKDDCTGCFACFNCCPKNAINMKEDEHGIIYPEIDKGKCINCGLCKKICPANNDITMKKATGAYAAFSKNLEQHKKSASGGIATILSEYIILHNGIVYGVVYDKNCNIHHKRITSIEELKKIRGSKYVHSYINDSFKLIKQDLINNLKVLFIGTPCQVSGLKQFLQREYENLYCIDIICHGVPSQKYLQMELGKYISEIDNISFRSSEGFLLRGYKEEKLVFSKTIDESNYFEGFLNGVFFRENCYNCKYAKEERCSDITIGDFWGLDKSSRLYRDRKDGISVVLPITEKGKILFDNIKDLVEYDKRSIEEAVKGNTQLREPSKKKVEYSKFYKNITMYDFETAYKKATKIKQIKKKIKHNKIINMIYKKIRKEN